MPPVGFEPTISADEWPLGLAVNCIRPNSKTEEHAIILHLTVLMNVLVLEAFTRSGQRLSIFIFLTDYIRVYNLSRFVIVYITRILSEVYLLYVITRLIIDVSSQRTRFNPMRVRIGLELDTGRVGGYCLGILRLSCLLFQQCSVLIFIHAPSQIYRLDTNTLAKQITDIPHRYDVSGVGLIKLVGYQYTLLTNIKK
jgi:hypothetical protein